MTHRICTNCGAPMHTTSMGAVVCEFCGVANEAVAWLPPITRPAPVSSRVPPLAIILSVIGFLMSASIVTVVMRSHQRPPTAAPVETSLPPIPIIPPAFSVAEPPPRAPLSALHTAALDWMNAIPIDGTAIVGSLDQFDALANWEWAMSVGQAWWNDAEIYKLHVEPIEKDGTANLTVHGASAEYVFFSKGCKKDRLKRAETEKLDRGSCTLAVSVAREGASVQAELVEADIDARTRPITKPTCSIAQVFDALETSKRLTPRPAYGIRLEHDVFGFRYTVSAGRNVATMPNIDASPSICLKH